MTERPQPSSAAEVRVGDYRLLTRIGEGGMGVVHLAQGPDGRRVALKVLRPHIIGDDEARERLSREVASLRLVKSPRVAEVIDADPWGETPFVATRYVPGLSLHQHIREQGPISGADLHWFAAGLMDAVVAVHSVDVLHRDIKPSNVLLEGRSPVLIDFGLARLAEDPRITHAGWLLGTPGYLAPEILYGDDATTASDVHSWAATVVFAATGHPPFGTGPAMAIMDRVRRGEHRLSSVPQDLLPLVRACLSPDPLDRPTTREVLNLLRAPAPEELTMPFALGAFHDDDATAVVDTSAVDASDATSRTRSYQQPPATRQLTVPIMQPAATHQPFEQHPVMEPARSPYMQPPPPQDPRYHNGPPAQGEAWQPLPSGTAKVQRGCLLLGMTAWVAVGFALAPYVCLIVLALAALTLRTVSWTTESARDRRYRRGHRRWYDAPITAVTSPWYLVVATGGTLALMLWSGALAFVTGAAYLVFGEPLEPGLLLMGVVLGLSMWWGPGSRRLRVPTRRLIVAVTRSSWMGWLAVALLAGVVGLLAVELAGAGVNWAPRPGAPWRDGTVLGRFLSFL